MAALEWTNDESGVWESASDMHDDGSPFIYVIKELDCGYLVCGDDELLPADGQISFETLIESQAYCQGLEDARKQFAINETGFCET